MGERGEGTWGTGKKDLTMGLTGDAGCSVVPLLVTGQTKSPYVHAWHAPKSCMCAQLTPLPEDVQQGRGEKKHLSNRWTTVRTDL